ncbi:MAG: hypothetical protein PHQ14_06630 [Chromatiales bacterium]|jgi:hypothetical protein|nr:hypothetical protein [Chromatiales bacterium]MDX9766695.1 hypothetical protein [Ectothiorhodospiraceae bacterium]
MNARKLRLFVNLGLIVIALALAAVVYFDPFQGDATDGRLTTLDPTAVRKVVIEFPDRPRIELERSDTGWLITDPVRIEAGPARIMQVLALVHEIGRAAYPVAEVDLEQAGLAPPEARIRFDDLAIELGRINPLNQNRYARIGDTVHLISSSRAGFVSADLAAYVSPRLLPQGADIRVLRLPDLVLHRNDDGNWQTEPALDENARRELLESWEGAMATSAQPLSGPAEGETVEIELGSGETLRFVVLAREPDVILARPDAGIRYNLPGVFRDGLFPAP